MTLAQLDSRLLLLLRTRGHSPTAERAVTIFSRRGEHGACWLVLGLVGNAVERSDQRRARWRHGVRVVLAAYAFNYAVKLLVRRPRPELPGLPPLTGVISTLSLPSAHATTSFAAASAYAGLLPRAGLYAVAVAMGLSRPYLGVHYPSDVLVGAGLGTAVAAGWPPPRGHHRGRGQKLGYYSIFTSHPPVARP